MVGEIAESMLATYLWVAPVAVAGGLCGVAALLALRLAFDKPERERQLDILHRLGFREAFNHWMFDASDADLEARFRNAIARQSPSSSSH